MLPFLFYTKLANRYCNLQCMQNFNMIIQRTIVHKGIDFIFYSLALKKRFQMKLRFLTVNEEQLLHRKLNKNHTILKLEKFTVYLNAKGEEII